MRHVISVLMENAPGALSRVVGLFSARGYNIETLTVAPTEDNTLSRLTMVTLGSDEVIEQITGSVTLARNLCGDVEWSAQDATRTERDVLRRCVEAAIRAGATTINQNVIFHRELQVDS